MAVSSFRLAAVISLAISLTACGGGGGTRSLIPEAPVATPAPTTAPTLLGISQGRKAGAPSPTPTPAADVAPGA